MRSVLAKHLRAKYVIRERVRRCGRGEFAGKVVVRACDPELTAAYADCPLRDLAVERDIMEVVVRACDPELTAAYADCPLKDLAVERDIMGQPCPLR